VSRSALRILPTYLLTRIAWLMRLGGLRADAFAVECELLARRLEAEWCNAPGGDA
jgi:hypothetical protein